MMMVVLWAEILVEEWAARLERGMDAQWVGMMAPLWVEKKVVLVEKKEWMMVGWWV